jgi:hypothetical protein
MAHFAVLGLMHDAALQAEEDPDRLSFLPSFLWYAWSNAAWLAPLLFPLRQRKTFHRAVLGEILQSESSGTVCVQPQQDQRTRRKAQNEQLSLGNYPLRPRKRQPTQRIEPSIRIRNP